MKVLRISTLALFTAVAGSVSVEAAEPVEYVKICNAYGTGYHWVPGTETCLRYSDGAVLPFPSGSNQNNQAKDNSNNSNQSGSGFSLQIGIGFGGGSNNGNNN